MKRPIKTISVTSHFERQYKKLTPKIQTLAEKRRSVSSALMHLILSWELINSKAN
jgi:hypothetical protein